MNEDTHSTRKDLETGLARVQLTTKSKVLGMVDFQGWYWFATSMRFDEQTQRAEFTAGFAIPQNTRKLLEWSEPSATDREWAGPGK